MSYSNSSSPICRRIDPRDWRTWPDDLCRRILVDYGAGELVKDIAAKEGIDLVTAGKFLRSAGVDTRNNASIQSAPSGKLDLELRSVIAKQFRGAHISDWDFDARTKSVEAGLRAVADKCNVEYTVTRSMYMSLGRIEWVSLVCNADREDLIPSKELRSRLLVEITSAIRRALDASESM